MYRFVLVGSIANQAISDIFRHIRVEVMFNALQYNEIYLSAKTNKADIYVGSNEKTDIRYSVKISDICDEVALLRFKGENGDFVFIWDDQYGVGAFRSVTDYSDCSPKSGDWHIGYAYSQNGDYVAEDDFSSRDVKITVRGAQTDKVADFGDCWTSVKNAYPAIDPDWTDKNEQYRNLRIKAVIALMWAN